MNKYALSLIATTCILTLTACSNSRGGSEVDNSKYLTEKPSISKPSSPNTNNTQTTPSTESNNSNPSNTNGSDLSNKPTETTKPSTPEKPTEEQSQSSNTNTTVSPFESVKPTQPISPFKDPLFIPSQNGPLVGAAITVKSDGSTTSINPINDGKEELNELVLDNKRFLLFNSRDLTNGNGMEGSKILSNNDVMKETPTNDKISGYVSGWGPENEFYNTEIFTSMRFGVVNINKDSALFIQGYQTPEKDIGYARSRSLYPIPKSGKFLYQIGHAFYGKDTNYQYLNAEVVADFNNKQLEVALKDNETKKVEFNATIEGNHFSGKTNGIETKGAFYGSRANEVGGIFFQTEGVDKGKNGVFGAVDARKIK